uniref:Putative secreted peptide n=1 Tax=Anopheles braziliensis TaxID=58242 RepID=A0A2M3ZW36_9DIPT
MMMMVRMWWTSLLLQCLLKDGMGNGRPLVHRNDTIVQFAFLCFRRTRITTMVTATRRRRRSRIGATRRR